MQCTTCGRDRPRTGNCPYCGAGPMVSRNNDSGSSMREWRDQTRGQQTPNQSSNQNSRPNYTDPRSPNSSSRTPSRSRNPDNGWESPNQSQSRRRVNDDNALVVRPGSNIPMIPEDDRNLPALPTEEEERAMGIRRPAFIPATEERRGERAGGWRVISGVLSLMLVCVGACGVTGVLARNTVLPKVASLVGINVPKSVSATPTPIPALYTSGTSLVTPAPNAPDVLSSIVSTKTYTEDATNIIPGPSTALFFVGDSIHIIARADKAKVGDVFSVKWIYNGQDITAFIKKDKPDCCSQSPNTSEAGEFIRFTLLQQQAGKTTPHIGSNTGRADIFDNNILVASVVFLVTDQPPTPTPVPPSPTPTVKK